MKQLKFSPDLVNIILSGQKTSTWRLWDDKDLTEGDIIEFFEYEKDQRFAQAKLISVIEKTFDELTEDDKEGHEKYKSNDEMIATCAGYYKRKVDGKTRLKIVKFELI